MPRSYQAINVNSFTKGLITEASPLTFPEGAASQLNNFNLNRDGTISRRLGLADRGTSFESSSSFSDKSALTNIYEWDSAGGVANARLLVIQDGTTARIFDRTSSDISASQIGTINLSVSPGTRVTFASINGDLVTATGGGSLYRTSYDGTSISTQTFRLKIRDVFGVSDGISVGQSVTTRPTTLTDLHAYNLRNQSWAEPRKLGNTETVGDPLDNYRDETLEYPSNADTVTQALFADPNDTDDRIGKRFFASEVRANPVGVSPAPRGYFIIDALNRGTDRLARVAELQSRYSYSILVNSLPSDTTPNGATVVEEYAGRAFYAGFSGAVIGGDENSPSLGSYVLFSRLVRTSSDLSECYSEADPTSAVDPDPVATDGGFVRVEGAHNIRAMRVLRDSLYVLAENGIWSISGGGDPFTAQSIVVNKLTDKGVTGACSVITTDQSLYYWSDSGIYVIGPNEFGDYHPLNLSNTTIQKLYNAIPFESKQNNVGVYDSYEQKIFWQYGGNSELVLDLNLEAFYTNTFGSNRNVRASFTIPPFQSRQVVEDVTVGGETVTVLGEAVTVSFEGIRSDTREVAYITAENSGGLTSVKFATKTETNFRDYGTQDALATMKTGASGLGDFQRYKNVPYLTLHFERTETGLTETFDFLNPSGCLVRVAWEWADSANSNRWTRQFQGYRLRRHYFPVGGAYDPGFDTVITKNKIRGKGKALSVHFETEPLKNCVLLGWSMIIGAAANV